MRHADRLFQIIQVLRRAEAPVTAAALARELEVSDRTIYRDVAHLIAQRVPIEGEAGFGYVLSASYDMPPLMLTPDEIEAVVLGAQWVVERGDTILSPAARDVIAKIAAVVPEHLSSFLKEPTVGARPHIGAAQWISTAGLRTAIRSGAKLRFRYRAGNGDVTERTVWPVIVGFSETSRVLIAWCESRAAFRHFRIDRMREVLVLPDAVGLRKGELRRRWREWRTQELARAVAL